MRDPEKPTELWSLWAGNRWLEATEDDAGDPILCYLTEAQALAAIAAARPEDRPYLQAVRLL